MNDLLKLLGHKYKLCITYDHYNGYVIVVNKGDLYASQSFHSIEAEVAEHDVLLCVVEECIMDIQDRCIHARRR